MMKPNRTNLSVPGHMKKMHAKALASQADVVMFDLEDSVPVEKKEDARDIIIQSLHELHLEDKTVTVRINGCETALAYREIVDLAENAGNQIDRIVVPKIDHPGDIYFVSRLLDGIEQAKKIKKRIQIEASIETANGLEAVSDIAKASNRLKTLVFGVADYSDSIGARLVSLSGHGENEEEIYPGHRWHYPLSKIVVAARANGLMAIDAPFGNFKNNDGLKRSAELAGALGYDGKWVIHPDQIDIVNQVFTPSPEEIKRAGKILDTIEKANIKGKGAVGVEGKMIDQATHRMAQKLWNQAIHLGLVR
ncbi:MAG: CoA ester lyase [Desulfobacterales bacterium]|nr:CoA ester lyase [Desulfobacterales bacterium]